MLSAAVEQHAADGKRLFLLGEIIHNPWVNEHFRSRGVRILAQDQAQHPERFIGPQDGAVVPAFGVPLPTQRRLDRIGCEIIDTTCGDVRRLWRWAEQAVADGYAVLIYGRATHDETVVTKSRLSAAGGRYVVVGDLDQARAFCELIVSPGGPDRLSELFGPEATNAESLRVFERLAQVSQTTMLYDETMQLRRLLKSAYQRRFGPERLEQRLRLQPTVCRATQQRQSAAVELCQRQPDLAIVVGGFGSSNTRHLFELARNYCPAYLIEDAGAIHSARLLAGYDVAQGRPKRFRDWLPSRRPVRIAVLAGASCPEIVIGQVLERLASFLGAC